MILGHTRDFLFLGMHEDISASPLSVRIALAPTAFAQESVAIFFVLSGYLVGGQVIREARSDMFKWRNYLIKRVSRLWTVLLPGLLLTALADIIAHRIGDTSNLNYGPTGPVYFLCNFAFLQQSRCPPYGSNESLWSLAYEFWFYVLFAAGTVVFYDVARRRWMQGAIGLLIFLGGLGLFGADVFRLLPSWLIGVLISNYVATRSAKPRIFGPSAHKRTYISLSLLGMIAGMILANYIFSAQTNVSQFGRFLLVGGASAPFVFLLAINKPANDTRALKLVSVSGNLSYSTYVYHAPLIKLIVVALLASGATLTGAGIVIIIYAIAVLACIVCVPIWWSTERNTNKVRDLLLRAFT